RLTYQRVGLFRPSDATILPEGDVLVLERRFTWIGGLASRLVRIPAADVTPGAVLRGAEVARIEPPLTVENYEGIATRRAADGTDLVYLVSDDNFNPLQRTLLMMFALEEAPATR